MNPLRKIFRKKEEPEKLPVEITPEELKMRLDAGERLRILDVRKRDEWQEARFQCSTLIPTAELPDRLNELDPNEFIVVHCQHGMRSMKALQFLKKHGFKNVRSLAGGIFDWRERIDPTLSHY